MHFSIQGFSILLVKGASGPKPRAGGWEDAAAIGRIYNQGIEERIATFETEPRTPEDIERLLAERGDHHPTIVVERDGEVVAWAGRAWRRPAARR